MYKLFFLSCILLGALSLQGVVHAQLDIDLNLDALDAPAAVPIVPTTKPSDVPNPLSQLNLAAKEAKLTNQAGTAPTLPVFAGRILGGVLYLVGLIFLGYTIFGGVTWMIARGNGEEVNKAKETIISSVIGLVVVTLGYVLTNFILTLLQTTSTT